MALATCTSVAMRQPLLPAGSLRVFAGAPSSTASSSGHSAPPPSASARQSRDRQARASCQVLPYVGSDRFDRGVFNLPGAHFMPPRRRRIHCQVQTCSNVDKASQGKHFDSTSPPGPRCATSCSSGATWRQGQRHAAPPSTWRRRLPLPSSQLRSLVFFLRACHGSRITEAQGFALAWKWRERS